MKKRVKRKAGNDGKAVLVFFSWPLAGLAGGQWGAQSDPRRPQGRGASVRPAQPRLPDGEGAPGSSALVPVAVPLQFWLKGEECGA